MADETKINSALEYATNKLGRYFGTMSKGVFVNMLIDLPDTAGGKILEDGKDPLTLKAPESVIGEMLLDVTEGAWTIEQILKHIDTRLTSKQDGETDISGKKTELRGILEILYEPEMFKDKPNVAELACVLPGNPDGKTRNCSDSYCETEYERLKAISPSITALHEADAPYYFKDAVPSIRSTIYNETLIGKLKEKWKTKKDDPPEPENYKEFVKEEGKINLTPSKLNKDEPNVAFFLIRDPRLNPGNRGVGAVATFINFIPTIEMSKCQPYLDIQVITPRTPLAGGDSGTIDTVSLAQFLMGQSGSLDKASADYHLASARNESILGSGMYKKEKGETLPIATAGMELFTAPQTMVDANDRSSSAVEQLYLENDKQTDPGGVASTRAASIIDRFRPFATITNFSVTVSPSGGMMSHKMANLDITLHDRSRLAEMGDLVKPDLYGSTELLIEYGWNHPDGHLEMKDNENVFARFLNAMRVKEKYRVVNSSFDFDEVGQINIGLTLSMVGMVKFDTTHIAQGSGVTSALKDVQDLLKVIREIRRKTQRGSKGATDVSGETWMSSVGSIGGLGKLDTETRAEIAKYIASSSGADKSTKALADALKAMLGKDGKGTSGKMKILNDTIQKAMKYKNAHIVSSHAGDPFWRPLMDDSDNFCSVRNSACSPRKDPFALPKERKPDTHQQGKGPAYVSLGKLLLTYVIPGLASEGCFDEIQVFTYQFNSSASYMWTRNIAEFPIPLTEFKKELAKLTSQGDVVPIKRFLGMIQRKFIRPSYAPAWGLTSLYTEDKDSPGNMILKEKTKKGRKGKELKGTILRGEKDRRLAAAYGKSESDIADQKLTFRKPRLGLFIDCVPAKASGSADKSAKEITILKIHIYDKAMTSHTTAQQLLAAARKEQLGQVVIAARETRNTSEGRTVAQWGLVETELKAAVMKSNLLEEFPGAPGTNTQGAEPPTFRIKGGFPAVKRFIRSSVPSIIYGASYSAVINAKLSSENDPQMATIMMMRARQEGNKAKTSATSRQSGLPLKVIPTTLDLTIMGCPLVSFGQQFFVDFGTGTTADNIYAVIGISHTLVSGEFITSLKMHGLDAYGAYETAMSAATNAFKAIEEAEATDEK